MLNAAQRDDLADEIRREIESNEIQLPTLPEVALQVRDAVENETANAAAIAALVANDAALTARLGNQRVRSLVVSLAMKQIFQATSDALDRQFRQVWDDSLQVAAISRVLAGTVPALENDQAMLGGLIHNIGALPILTKIDQHWGFDANDAMITALIDDLAPEIGARILRHWHFADTLADIPLDCQNLAYDPGPVATYADVVMVARLQNVAAKGGPAAQADWSQVPAFAKIGFEPEVVIVDMEGPAAEIAEVRSMLEG